MVRGASPDARAVVDQVDENGIIGAKQGRKLIGGAAGNKMGLNQGAIRGGRHQKKGISTSALN